MRPGEYKGDVSSTEAWEKLSSGERAALVDVRTAAEWTFVGVPDLSETGSPLLRVEWQSFPSMAVNPAFVETVAAQLEGAGVSRDDAVYFLCRSGARSAAAAAALSAAGFTRCFNVADGFEGPPDDERHRGNRNGWKAAALPWVQS